MGQPSCTTIAQESTRDPGLTTEWVRPGGDFSHFLLHTFLLLDRAPQTDRDMGRCGSGPLPPIPASLGSPSGESMYRPRLATQVHHLCCRIA